MPGLQSKNKHSFNGFDNQIQKLMSIQIYAKAVSLHQSGDLQRAIKSYSEFLKSEPNHPQVNCLKASALQASNRHAEAIAHYLIAHQESPNDPAITLEIALCFSKIGNLDRSNFFYEKTIALNPHDARAWTNLGNNLTKLKLYKKAFSAYESAYNLEQNSATICYNIGTMFLEAMDPDSALPWLRKAVALNPKYPAALNSLGVALTELGDLNSAIDFYESSLQIDPTFVEPVFNLHMVFIDTGEIEKAISILQKAGWLDPKNSVLKFFLAMTLAYRGDKDLSLKIFNQISHIKKISGELDSWEFIKSSSPTLPKLTGTNFTSIKYAMQAAKLEGLILEFGVFNGKSIRRIAEFSSSKIYGFDSFEGIPETWNDEPSGSYSAEGVLPTVPKNVTLVKGWFNDTIPIFLNQLKTEPIIRFLHIDCDLYSSTKTIFDLLGKYIQPGTVILFDELIGYKSWQKDEFKAFMEAAKMYSWNYEILLFSFATKQVAIKINSSSQK